MDLEEVEGLLGDIQEAVDEDQYELSKWEEEFLESVLRCSTNQQPLTPRQEESLRDLHGKATGDG